MTTEKKEILSKFTFTLKPETCPTDNFCWINNSESLTIVEKFLSPWVHEEDNSQQILKFLKV